MTRVTPQNVAESFTAIEQARAASHGSSRRRLLPNHPLDVFLEVRFPGRERALVIASGERLGNRQLVMANGLTCSFREGYVEVVAQPTTDAHIFCTLLADLVDHLERTSVAPAAAVVRRIASWQRVLGRGLGGVLRPEARIGLFGELLVLRDVVLPACGRDAVSRWLGPAGGVRDFAWGAWGLEVKTVSGDRGNNPLRCRIHGEEQLDEGSLDYLALVHQQLRSDQAGSSLCDLVDELRAHPSVEGQEAVLENCLVEAGWFDVHRSHYEGERWQLEARRCYRVTETFPRLVPHLLPEGISSLSYDLDLGACGQALVGESQVLAVLGTGVHHPGEGDG
ncbi:PD-(D/E)XK motif protein [Streptomyces indiaensis]|uniref:PD-(D/E)XK motif protein n=1 Tax=Streptomyces indiaensis TaxID=284033 RepID=A0ABN3DP83_9ACTN|nr:PD-(D/E)XK motif protein [Streptomyces indiaensis]MCF1648296.1 PD-(D/E)XK motif protein [Streptomyces indiaensis]